MGLLKPSRRASASEIDTKVARFNDDWSQVNRERDEADRQADLVAIVSELLANLVKIKGCRKAVESDLFSRDEDMVKNPKD